MKIWYFFMLMLIVVNSLAGMEELAQTQKKIQPFVNCRGSALKFDPNPNNTKNEIFVADSDFLGKFKSSEMGENLQYWALGSPRFKNNISISNNGIVVMVSENNSSNRNIVCLVDTTKKNDIWNFNGQFDTIHMATISPDGEKIALSYVTSGGFNALNILDIYNRQGEPVGGSANLNGVVKNPSFSLDSSLVGYVGTNQVVIQKVDDNESKTIFNVKNPWLLKFIEGNELAIMHENKVSLYDVNNTKPKKTFVVGEDAFPYIKMSENLLAITLRGFSSINAINIYDTRDQNQKPVLTIPAAVPSKVYSENEFSLLFDVAIRFKEDPKSLIVGVACLRNNFLETYDLRKIKEPVQENICLIS